MIFAKGIREKMNLEAGRHHSLLCFFLTEKVSGYKYFRHKPVGVRNVSSTKIL
jgi:hypothetical protein